MRCIKKMVTAEAFRYDGDLKGADGEYYVPRWAAEAFEKGILFYAPLEHGAPPTELFLCVPHEKPLRVPAGYYVVRDERRVIGRLSPTLFHDIYEEWPAGDEGGGWIAVEDRLPENLQEVLVWYEYFRYGGHNSMCRTYGIGCHVNGHWSGDVSGYKARCIAWRPLPDPYHP